jgi:hypothetical protein
VLELKGGRVDVSEVGGQLQGAATVVEGAVDASGEVDFVPLLVHRGLPTMSVNRLRVGAGPVPWRAVPGAAGTVWPGACRHPNVMAVSWVP